MSNNLENYSLIEETSKQLSLRIKEAISALDLTIRSVQNLEEMLASPTEKLSREDLKNIHNSLAMLEERANKLILDIQLMQAQLKKYKDHDSVLTEITNLADETLEN